MRDYLKFYIGGKWVRTRATEDARGDHPATETVSATSHRLGRRRGPRVKAAREAFKTFSQTTARSASGLLERIVAEYEKRREDIAKAITEEMGAPVWLAQRAQAAMGAAHFTTAIQVLKTTSSRRTAGRR